MRKNRIARNVAAASPIGETEKNESQPGEKIGLVYFTRSIS